MAMKIFTGIILLAYFNIQCFAEDIYQYVDKNGTTVFSNKPVKGAKKVNLPPITVYASPMTKNDYNAAGYTNPVAPKKVKNINVVNTKNLGTNEVGRNQVLSDELQHEKQALSDAQKALDTGKQTKLDSEKNNPEQYQASIQGLQDAVTEHEKNIDILTKQLGGN